MSCGLSVGIVGLPNVGKSTLFNAITSSQTAQAANYPFCTIEPNVGIVEVPDKRLAILAEQSKSKKIVPAAIEFVDIAGLVAGASKGEGLGNQFLANIRECHAIVQVLRCFESEEITHVAGSVDPIRDLEIIETELCLADVQMAENTLRKLGRQIKPELKTLLESAIAHLNQGKPLRQMAQAGAPEFKSWPFLTNKPQLYLANVSEAAFENEWTKKVYERAAYDRVKAVTICASLEAEIAQCSPQERKELLASYGLEQSGLERLVTASYDLLNLMSFLTTGEIETRAWTIPKGTPAPLAAGKIHTDIQKGFIRAEVCSFDDLLTYRGKAGVREKGLLRTEGKDYIMQEGDVVVFLHN